MSRAKRKPAQSDAAPAKTPEKILAEMARAALDANGNLEKAATDALFAQITGDATLYAVIAGPMVRIACYDAVRRANSTERRQIRLVAVQNADQARAGVAAAARATKHFLMDYPLAGGIRLGDATREDIMRTVEYKLAQAGAMQADARWLQLVAQSLPAGQRVRETISEERLLDLRADLDTDTAATS